MIKSKKAQGAGFSTAELMVTIAIIATIFIVLIGFWAGWDKIIGVFKVAPDDYAQTAAYCANIAGSPDLIADYCGYANFKEVTIAKVKQRINCEELAKISPFDTRSTVCDSALVATSANTTCRSSVLNLKDNYLINRQPCSYWKAYTPATPAAPAAPATLQTE